MNQVGIWKKQWVYINGQNMGGCDLSPFSMRYDLLYGNFYFDEFPNEIRSPGIPEVYTFEKPSEFEYDLSAFGLLLYQRGPTSPKILDARTGGIPSNFFVVDGDKLTFYVKDYLYSLGDARITKDGLNEGYNIYFYPKIRGNCQSEAGTYTACANLIADVNDKVFGQDKYEHGRECETFEYTGGPKLIASSSQPIVQVFNPGACVEIKLSNISNIDAPNSWLNIQSLTGGMVVTSLTEITAGANTEITPTDFGLYHLGTTVEGTVRVFQLCVNITDCQDQELAFASGWGCLDYPETVEEATCNNPSSIKFESVSGKWAGNLQFPGQSVEYELCQDVDFAYRFSSTDLGYIDNINFDFKLPKGMEYIPGTFEIAYPVPWTGDTTWTFVQDPTNTYNNNYTIDVSSLNDILSSTGLIGSLGAINNENIVLVRWKAETNCDYVSGSRASFVATADNLCGDHLPTIRSRSPRMYIKDVLPEYDIDLTLDELALNPCNNDEATVNISLEIDAAPGVVTKATDTIKIIMAPGVEYKTSSYAPGINATTENPQVLDDNGSQYLVLPIEAGLVDGDVINFSIDIATSNVGQSCGYDYLVVQTYSTTNISCKGAACSIGVLSGEDVVSLDIQKPDLSILTTDLSLVSMPPSDASLEYKVEVVNNGSIGQLQDNDLVFEFWSDENNNGLWEPGTDVKIKEVVNNISIPAGQTALVTGTVDVPPTGICNTLVVLNPISACVCSEQVSNQTKIKIKNEFDKNVSVCSNIAVEIGPGNVDGFNYQWVSINASDLGALSSTTSTPVDFEYDNNSGSNIVWDYAIRSSFGNCYSYDTMTVTVFKENDDEVDVTTCLRADFQLPGPTTGTNFNWTPTTNLDDPTLASPTINNITSSGTYNLTYTDENGCAATKKVNVVAIECAPMTALGDTVWFDQNKDGVQDPGEVGVPGMVVYLYNSTNTTLGNHIASTTTDANGRYIFDNLPSGNYVVSFEPLDGFEFTTSNSGDDKKDSDANPATGNTPPIFLPNGVYDSTWDAGLIPDCNLEVLISGITDCLYDGTDHSREVTIDINWENAVYTYPFLGGKDSIQLDVYGQTFKYEITQLSGDISQVIVIDNQMPVDITADAKLLIDNVCTSTTSVNNILPCIYDVALIKKVTTPKPYKYGDILNFDISVQNQGYQDLNNVKINDFLPAGFTFDPAINTGWTQSAPDNLVYTITDRLNAGETKVLPLKLKLIMSSEKDAYLNTSEVESFTDTLNVDRSQEDEDSTPDNDPSNDAGGNPNTGSDNSLTGNGTGSNGDTNPNTDEDDHDPELIRVVDLALKKSIVTQGPYDYGDDIEFSITVYNQGNIQATDIEVNDYIPDGFMYLASNAPTWSESGGVAKATIPGPLASGDSVKISIVLKLQEAAPDQYTNISEISSFKDKDGKDITADDIDSTADDDPDNDAGGNPNSGSDDATNGNGTGNAGDSDSGTDEDDSDPAYIAVPKIGLEKSTISVVPAASGTPGHFDATYKFVITNTGNQILTGITLNDDLVEQLGAAFIGITRAPEIVDVTNATQNPSIVTGYNAGVIESIFDGTDGTLEPDQTITVQMVAEVTELAGPEPVINEGYTDGKSPDDETVSSKDTAVVDAPDCYLETICPLDQVELTCISEIPATGTDANWFNALDGHSAIVSACGVVTVTVEDSNNGGTGCEASPYILTRTIIVTDPGDGTSQEEKDTCKIVYTVIDDEKPTVMTAPHDLYLTCGEDNATAIQNWINANGGGMFVEPCGTPNVAHVKGTAVEQCGNTTITPYIFTATDACGNSVTYNANVVLSDNTPPELTLPTGASTVNCDASPAPDPDAWAATATATDDCGTPIVTYSLINAETVCNGTVTQKVYTYLFTATDECGNESQTQTANYTVVKNVEMTLTAPPALSLSCGQNFSLIVAEWLDDYVVTDQCAQFCGCQYTVTNDYDATANNLSCGETIPVTFTLTTGCGHEVTATSEIQIAPDNTPPTINCVSSYTFNVNNGCEANVTLPLPSADDDCNEVVSVRQIEPLPGEPFPIGTTEVKFEAKDACGNKDTCTTNVIVVDNDDPVLSCPPGMEVCADADQCYYTGDASLVPVGSDCSALTYSYKITNPDNSVATQNTLTGYQFKHGLSSIEITGTDGTNTSTCTFTITVKDCEKPTLTCTDMTNVDCGGDVAKARTDWINSIEDSAGDNCNPFNFNAQLLTDISSCGTTIEQVYEFTVTDIDGNKSVCYGTFKTVDNTPPTITIQASNKTITCTGASASTALVAWLNDNGGARANDDCGNVTWSNNYDGTITGACGNTGTYAVIFTATDECGNTSVPTTANFIIQDNTVPTLYLPDNITLDCDDDNKDAIIATWLATAYAIDGCDGTVNVTNNYTTSSVIDGCGSTGLRTLMIQGL